MARKPQKSQAQLSNEQERRFYEALNKIQAGQTRKQAILSSHMDQRTFNKMLAAREENGTRLLTQRYTRRTRIRAGQTSAALVQGKYDVGLSVGALKQFAVFHKDGSITMEVFDNFYASIMGKYWNSVEQFVYHGNTSYLDSFHPHTVFTINGEEISLQFDKRAIERWWRQKSLSQRDSFNERLYNKEVTYAA